MYSPEITQIHQAFNTAGDTLLAGANQLISQVSDEQIDKVSRLQRTGFVATLQVTESADQLEKRQQAQAQAALIQGYALHYPNQKFITAEQVETICKRYRLLCGPVGSYKGFVPDANLRQIEAFALRPEDVIEKFRVTKVKFTFPLMDRAGIADVKAYLKERKNLIDKSDLRGLSIASFLSHRIGKRGEIGITSIDSLKFEKVDNALQICAPSKDFVRSGLSLSSVFLSAINRTVYEEIPDPVVLQPINGGYLILTAWGDEASDPLVVNPRFN